MDNANQLSLTHQMAQMIVSTRFDDFSEENVKVAKRFLLDTLAVSWAGSDAPGCQEAYALSVSEGGRADSHAWGYGGRLPAMSAAFMNGMSAAALDYDGIGSGASVHVNITVLPAAMAMAQRLGANGKDFLSAYIIGADLTYRLALAADSLNEGFHYVPLYGLFGAAAAASRLLGLTVMQTRHALGIAFMQGCGTQQANIDPSISKRMMSGFAARAGVHAALLAKLGLTGPEKAIEGRFGLFNMYQSGKAETILEALGERFDNVQSSIKLYPSCGANHTTIAGMLDLIQIHDLSPQEVLSVEVTLPPYAARLVGGLYDPTDNPQVAAQFNVRYTIACLLVRRRLGLAEIQPSAARDPLINAEVSKISVKVDETLTTNRGPIELRLQTRTKGTLYRRVEHVPGSLQAPVSEDILEQKIVDCFQWGAYPLDHEKIKTLRQRVQNIQACDNMNLFFDSIM